MQPERFAVIGVFTAVIESFQRVSIHSTPTRVLQTQAARVGVPLYEIPIPCSCSNAQYESASERSPHPRRTAAPMLPSEGDETPTLGFDDLPHQICSLGLSGIVTQFGVGPNRHGSPSACYPFIRRNSPEGSPQCERTDPIPD